ncbi:MAG: hypothetical protein JWQ18_2431 [Conexibacter sp.]|nr:hypothetical protein [Conexibacter sp.]
MLVATTQQTRKTAAFEAEARLARASHEHHQPQVSVTPGAVALQLVQRLRDARRAVVHLALGNWIDGQKFVAVRPTPAFAVLFAASESAGHPCEARGALDGSDGTRTRDLRRDRPAL